MQFNERLKFLGIRVVSVSQGIDTDSEPVVRCADGQSTAWWTRFYVKELAKKTHRGLEGKVLNGEHTGGRCFGYDAIRATDGKVRLEIESDRSSHCPAQSLSMAASGGIFAQRHHQDF